MSNPCACSFPKASQMLAFDKFVDVPPTFETTVGINMPWWG